MKMDFVCHHCGKPFKRPPSQRRGKYPFCSRACCHHYTGSATASPQDRLSKLTERLQTIQAEIAQVVLPAIQESKP
jgi:hypothetical protein